jgi:hypothetical protein
VTSRPRGPRRPLPELPADLQQYRNISREETAALIGISLSLLDQATYGDAKRQIPPWGPPSFTIRRRRLWRLRDVVKWIDRQARAAG